MNSRKAPEMAMPKNKTALIIGLVFVAAALFSKTLILEGRIVFGLVGFIFAVAFWIDSRLKQKRFEQIVAELSRKGFVESDRRELVLNLLVNFRPDLESLTGIRYWPLWTAKRDKVFAHVYMNLSNNRRNFLFKIIIIAPFRGPNFSAKSYAEVSRQFARLYGLEHKNDFDTTFSAKEIGPEKFVATLSKLEVNSHVLVQQGHIFWDTGWQESLKSLHLFEKFLQGENLDDYYNQLSPEFRPVPDRQIHRMRTGLTFAAAHRKKMFALLIIFYVFLFFGRDIFELVSKQLR